ncbi:hypothetical protein B1812_07005 [Methylocystis bryophila]|uniref:Uncharacterized protein n=1 Tax=Methylocystis bryophila TaxID=655015 RepID=A0A1W6MTG5_9HYPH|nr:hypothetical protein B1812_07005 [Methylocystis bryophila]
MKASKVKRAYTRLLTEANYRAAAAAPTSRDDKDLRLLSRRNVTVQKQTRRSGLTETPRSKSTINVNS